MTPLNTKRRGELHIALGALLWSLFPIVTILTFSQLTPILSAGVSTLIAALFFAVILTVKKEWMQIRMRSAWKSILLTTFYIGVLFYGFIFLGLRHTTAGNESIMALMEVFFSFLILGLLLRHERLHLQNIIGGACMMLGAGFILMPKASGWHSGDLLVILATVFAPLGNKYAQEARKFVSTNVIMFYRSLLSGLFLLLVAFFLEPLPTIQGMKSSLMFLIVNGILLLGLSKILWIEGINLIPITEAISLESITPLFTLLVAYFVLQEKVRIFQIAGLVPIIAGIFFLMKDKSELAK